MDKWVVGDDEVGAEFRLAASARFTLVRISQREADDATQHEPFELPRHMLIAVLRRHNATRLNSPCFPTPGLEQTLILPSQRRAFF